MSEITQRLSGVVVNQNKRATSSYVLDPGTPFYQEFYLPNNYTRVNLIPALSGIQVEVGVLDRSKVLLNFTLECFINGSWTTLASKTLTTAPYDQIDRQWATIYFDDQVEIIGSNLTNKFRFSVTTQNNTGVNRIWYSTPNPYSVTSALAYMGNVANTTNYASRFRILGLVADFGTDYLGNTYRSAVFTTTVDNISTGSTANSQWISKPNPSRFAIESLYFNLTANDGTAPVIDSFVLDPITPGVFFNIYFSSEGDPGTTPDTWDSKLWQRVPQTFRATKRETHVFGSPVVARYIKIEFSHLQAKAYSPGDFAKPVVYRKHPKWVLDYFLARATAQRAVESNLIAGRVGVVYDALDIAYSYYLDDITQTPDEPIVNEVSKQSFVQNAINTNTDNRDRADPESLNRINLILDPYRSDPSVFSKISYLLSQATQPHADYPVERPDLVEPISLPEIRNQAVVFEADFPVMFFFLTSRHKYKEVSASLDNSKAYFVGVREIAFLRDHYSITTDTPLYNEVAGDSVNMSRNDFRQVNGQMVV